jgi:hypothetical protein
MWWGLFMFDFDFDFFVFFFVGRFAGPLLAELWLAGFFLYMRSGFVLFVTQNTPFAQNWTSGVSNSWQ